MRTVEETKTKLTNLRTKTKTIIRNKLFSWLLEDLYLVEESWVRFRTETDRIDAGLKGANHRINRLSHLFSESFGDLSTTILKVEELQREVEAHKTDIQNLTEIVHNGTRTWEAQNFALREMQAQNEKARKELERTLNEKGLTREYVWKQLRKIEKRVNFHMDHIEEGIIRIHPTAEYVPWRDIRLPDYWEY